MFKKLPWKWIGILSIFAFIRPFLSILGISEVIGKPLTNISVTILISVVWIFTIVLKQVPQPFLTLLFVGMGYGLLAIIMSGIFSPILTGHLQGPLTHPLGIVSVLITNALWGGLTGFIASFLLKRKHN